ncbi:GTP:AMP phosphotransferase, mitochondrial [Trichomonascus vanleenenianus]|uniref:adenylate kinase ADK2 n=1 Tax=Trichomonascus vanleenenianus TaxID=2268995 RepID=UPI003ECBA95C
MRPLRALFLGAPGSGKGTQVSRLVRDFPHIAALSSGDVLRQNIVRKTPVGIKAASIIEQGGLVPDETMVNLIKEELSAHNWLNSKASWLLDGFPRTAPQAPPLDALLKEYSAGLNFVVELKVPEEVILDRIENRYVHLPSGRVYNLTFNPPKVAGRDDVTGEPLSKRPDDTPEVFKKRLDKYRDMTMPLKEYYDKQGILKSIEGETSDIIYPKLKKLIVETFHD